MRLTGLGLASIGIVIIGTATSYPQIRGNQIKAAHKEAVTRMVKECRVLPEGQDVQAGFYYASYLDPSKKWTDANTGKAVFEGALLRDGIAKSVCSLRGTAAEIGPNGVAQNVRSINPTEMRRMLKERYPEGIPFSDMAIASRVWVPNFEARAHQAEKPKTTMEIGK